MPLVIITGYPCCGKTSFAIELVSYIKEKGGDDITCILVNEESIGINKIDGYKGII